MAKICIDPGHGGTDPGAVHRGHEEKEICLAIGLMLCGRLAGGQPRGVALTDVVMTRKKDIPVPLARRALIANEAHADLFVSIHCNADPDPDDPGMPEASGAEIWIYPGSHKSAKLAFYVGEQLRMAMPEEPWRGVKEGNLAVLRLTRMPACLIEVGFIDDTETVRRLLDLDVQEEIARAIAEGIESYLQAVSDSNGALEKTAYREVTTDD